MRRANKSKKKKKTKHQENPHHTNNFANKFSVVFPPQFPCGKAISTEKQDRQY